MVASTPPSIDTHGIQLPERFEIRRLEPRHEAWAIALVSHCNLFLSEVWAPLCLGMQARICLQTAQTLEGSYLPTIDGGWAYGIFDKEYEFKRPESAATGGAVYWSEFNATDPALEIDGRQKLLDAMDFPLVSIGMAYDASDPHPFHMLFGNLAKTLPFTGIFFSLAPKEEDKIDLAQPATSHDKPKPGQALGRTGSATRDGYIGKGLMRGLSHFLMYEAKAKGFKTINVGMTSHAIFSIWSNPPAPFKAVVTRKFSPRDYEVVINGESVKLFEKCVNGLTAAVTVELGD